MSEESPTNEKTSINWLKELSGIGLGVVAILYVCGYLIHIVYYRLLGVDVGAQPLTYLKLAGDYLVSILISIPQLFSLFGEYRHALYEDLLWLGILFCFLSLICIFLLRRRRPKSRLLKSLIFAFILFTFLIIISSEFKVLRARNVLQPFSSVEMGNYVRTIADENNKPMEKRVSLTQEIYEEHEKLGVNEPGFDEWDQWFNPLNPSNRQAESGDQRPKKPGLPAQRERANSYLALMLLNILFLGVVFMAFWLSGNGLYSKVIRIEALTGLLVALLLFPCIYATLGKVTSFSVVRLKLKVESGGGADRKGDNTPQGDNKVPEAGGGESEQKELLTHPVFLIFQDESEVIVYDRLNLFQIKRVPRSQVININQLSNASPFDNCQLEKGFTPCESLWVESSTPIIDF
ncbi:MAG TPA: hypothetical protein VF543_18860 [Pyrinomonadaceae bacterium]|jgi:hypothetical protein